jgi:anaerobic selenocysteine-containing dehydrogenase
MNKRNERRATSGLTGAPRDAIFVSAEDAERLGLADRSPIQLASAHGRYRGRVFRAAIRPGNLEVHWPEGNILLGPDLDPDSLEPDYNAVVTIEPVQG